MLTTITTRHMLLHTVGHPQIVARAGRTWLHRYLASSAFNTCLGCDKRHNCQQNTCSCLISVSRSIGTGNMSSSAKMSQPLFQCPLGILILNLPVRHKVRNTVSRGSWLAVTPMQAYCLDSKHLCASMLGARMLLCKHAGMNACCVHIGRCRAFGERAYGQVSSGSSYVLS